MSKKTQKEKPIESWHGSISDTILLDVSRQPHAAMSALPGWTDTHTVPKQPSFELRHARFFWSQQLEEQWKTNRYTFQ